ncbi:MAG: type II secretion system protein [Patescibacteria group bacterium]|jgi:type II secretory pathway pseudopilin PulG
MRVRKSFSLVEVLVFVSILSLFFITALSITTFSIRNLKIQEHKILATRYAEEGIEWLKQEKEDDWQNFTLHDDGTGTTYCLNSNPLDWTNQSTNCNDIYSLGSPVGIFKRVLMITNSGTPVDSIVANMTVSWKENNTVQSVILKSVLNLWE